MARFGRLGRFGQGCVRLGVDWHGSAGKARQGKEWRGWVRYGRLGLVSPGLDGCG